MTRMTLGDGRKFYTRLDDALDNIAGRSFYEDARVSPVVLAGDHSDIIGYIVSDEHESGIGDDWTWTRAGGVGQPESVSEVSRLHAEYESYDEADHIRYNMPEAVGALENGDDVVFGYAAVPDLDVERDDETGEATDGDEYAGWLLAAIIYRSEGDMWRTRMKIEEYRQRLLARDAWSLHDEGTWEEYARPGGCHFDDPDETAAYAFGLLRRVWQAEDEPAGTDG